MAARNGSNTAGASPALAGNPGTCRYGEFDGQNDYVESPGLSSDLNSTASLAFWIRTEQDGNDVGWQAPGVAGVEQNGGDDDIFWGWLDSEGRIGLSVGNDFDNWKSSTSVNTGGWYHVALTRDHQAGTFKIYVDGVLENSGSISPGVIGTAFSSLGRIELSGAAGGNYLEGDLDEVRVYDFVLTDEQAAELATLTHPCDVFVSAYRVEHSGVGLNCEAENILVTALDSEGIPVEPPAGTQVVLSATPDTVTWPEGNSALFSGEQTTVQLPLQQTTPQTLIIEATDGVASGISDTLSINEAALRFCGDLALNPIPNQIAAQTDTEVIVRAVQANTDTGACEARVVGNQVVDFGYECLDPGSCVAGQSLTLSGGTAAATDAGGARNYAPISLTFDAQGVAAIPVNYTDVGRVRLHGSLALPANANDPADTLTGSSNSFVVKPHRLAIRSVETPSGEPNPGTTDSGNGFVAAGETFIAIVDALNAEGAVTPNFGNESAPERVVLDYALAHPSGGRIGNLAGVNGATTDAGVSQFDSLVWDEMGALLLTPLLLDGSYLEAGDIAEPANTVTVGRFYPARYQLVRHEVLPACSAFSYLSKPGITVDFRPWLSAGVALWPSASRGCLRPRSH